MNTNKPSLIRRLLPGLILFASSLPAFGQASISNVPNSFTAGGAIYAAAVNANFANLYANDGALNAQLGKLDSANWSTVTGGLKYSGGNIGIPGGKTIGFSNDVVPDGQFQYDTPQKTAGSYAIGWFIDSWDTSAASCWLSGFGGIKLFTANQPRLSINNAGAVGIGTTSPATRLHVSDSWAGGYAAIVENVANANNAMGMLIKAGTTGTPNTTHLIAFQSPSSNLLGAIRQVSTGSISYDTTSDGRLKTDISPTRYSLADLMKVQVRDYRFKSDPNGPLQTGFIAQELYEAYPAAVTKPAAESGTWGVDYGKLSPLLVKSIQDQQAQLEALRRENADLKARLAAIEKKLGL